MIPMFKPLAKRSICLLIAIFFSLGFAFADDLGDGGDDPDIPTIPLDGGLSVLLVAGAAYGGKKIRDYRKAKNK